MLCLFGEWCVYCVFAFHYVSMFWFVVIAPLFCFLGGLIVLAVLVFVAFLVCRVLFVCSVRLFASLF